MVHLASKKNSTAASPVVLDLLPIAERRTGTSRGIDRSDSRPASIPDPARFLLANLVEAWLRFQHCGGKLANY